MDGALEKAVPMTIVLVPVFVFVVLIQHWTSALFAPFAPHGLVPKLCRLNVVPLRCRRRYPCAAFAELLLLSMLRQMVFVSPPALDPDSKLMPSSGKPTASLTVLPVPAPPIVRFK